MTCRKTRDRPIKFPSRRLRNMLNRWDALISVLGDGRIALDNDPVERALCGVAVGRKNHLFASSDGNADRAALYSLIEAAKLSGLDPGVYLHDVLVRFVEHPATRLGDLLRWIWVATQRTAQAA